MSSLEAKLQAGTKEFQKIQTEYGKAVEHRQRLDAQKSESEAVKKEFASLTPSNTIYKQVGPVLLKQDQSEAKANVEKRLEFIAGEITRVEASLQDLDTKMESKKMELVHLQTQIQQKRETEQQALGGAPAGVKAAV
ncbi:Prefoldin [Leucosporidium creatinivorum]|uniref:Prefoldin n=1 Tax=Leucosporidium creatinivorum TaxID=106004 RepID=A0A1Y2ELM1_9BASI|nr:Prefoldin [Leucosporidium creatinivorum]